MIIKCPECASRFAVQDESIGITGRFVRCGRCLHIWFQIPADETEPAPTIETQNKPVSGQLPSLSIDKNPKNTLWLIAILFSVINIIIFIYLFFLKKDFSLNDLFN